MATQTNKTSGWVGWVYFAAIMMIVQAIFQVFIGIVDLTKHTFYLVTQNQLAVFNFTAWGWIDILLGVVLFTAGFSLLHGGFYGRVIGIFVSSLSLLANLIFLPAYPVWGIAALIIDALVLYALVVHGGEADTE